ncbi:hypothetical protein Kpol_1018p119 [Vanderwaltozyma polyspora DSM 70294]|uniref:Arrestin C-terminal-like domain-containing protein n=1 Tax=Vanderwaltozyma polyspora (strain ATCC 22028 / DSM 70294 / BCRC 21397 / CBS 2163 / NBRC 10782 / NRRL Y-8283 / UCD 57-17) TaxID=436907 RepID=A7TDW3_VANPO|nr:uncharacterized protein Kpol_1018p119 [Vanderwaltozyma polyspora DSM 70294]EDO19583.1 hypothetical protein Kpol_1018p119 [Vanderwaltozyma polyspora DSM 70294]
MFTTSKSSKQPILFDIRLNNTENDVILLKGPPDTASSVFLSGKIVLSILEPIQIRSVYLRLYGRLRLNIPGPRKNSNSKEVRYNKFERRFYEHCWDNINIQNYFQNLYDNYGKQTSIASKSSENLAASKKDNKSTLSLSSLAGNALNSSNYHTLVKGNYEFPFSAILPGSINESVEGLPNASVVYKLHATIERNKGSTDLMCEKRLRIVRTQTPDAVELSETITVDNIWPDKVEYSISVPARAIAIGSTTKIHMHLIPLIKGLQLGPIKINLIENSQYCGSYSPVTYQERLITKLKIKDPLGHVELFSNKLKGRNIPNSVPPMDYQDAWDITAEFQIPASLSKCTQDCNVLKNIKVRHKLKFIISLINPDGHISELRASLTVQLYISPFISLGVKSEDLIDTGHVVLDEAKKDQHLRVIEPEGDDEDEIFSGFGSRANSVGVISSKSLPDLMTPPQYENHVYDRLWNNNSEIETIASNSNLTTPHNSSNNLTNLTSAKSMDELKASLDKISLDNNEIGANNSNNSGLGISYLPGSISNNIEGTPNILISLEDVPSHVVENSPDPTPAFYHISRANSFVNQAPSSSPKIDWEIQSLSKVPSYGKAMKNPSVAPEFPPAYPSTGNSEHSKPIEKPQMVRHRGTSISSQGSSNRNSSIRNFLSRSNNSSSTSLNALAEHSTGGSFTLPILSSPSLPKNNTASKHFSFGMTPYGEDCIDSRDTTVQNRLQVPHSQTDSSRRRSNSLNSIMNVFGKREE